MGGQLVRPFFGEIDMQYYFAPLEGLTDSTYRRLHHHFYPGIDRYYTPFFSPTVHRELTPREQAELPPADTLRYCCIPQLLTKVSEDFLWMAQQCADRGYAEVNLNLGCPSGTVTAKGKGSGMLTDPETLDRFLDSIFSRTPLPISAKTRIGFASGEEFPELLDIFNRYPICELTVHPRIRKVFYDGNVDMDAFSYAYENSKNPICFNGNLCSRQQAETLQEQYPKLNAVMLGRGLIAAPDLLSDDHSADTLESFHDALLEEYLVRFGGSRNAMFRIKENWRYLLCRFGDSEKLGKQLRKTTDIAEYRAITKQIFHTLPIKAQWMPDW